MTKLKDTVREQHAHIDATRFHSLAALTEFVAQARANKGASLQQVRDDFHLDGPALRKKYDGGFCTTNTQALVQEAAKAGARGYLLDVPYHNSLRPLKRALVNYDGPVHVDAAYIAPDGSATHVVSGVGSSPEFVKHFDDIDHLRAYLLAEGYAPDAVAAIGGDGVATDVAFDKVYRQQLAMRHQSYINDPLRGVLGVNLVKGELFISSAALKAYDGPLLAADVGAGEVRRGGASWPLDVSDRHVNVVNAKDGGTSTMTARDAYGAVVEALGAQFMQPEDFAQNMVALAEMREAFVDEILAPSVSHAERALTQLPAWRTTSWPRIDAVSSPVRAQVASLIDGRDPTVSATFGAYFRDVLQVYATLRLEPPSAADVDALASQAAVVVGRTGADVAARLRGDEANALAALHAHCKGLPSRPALAASLQAAVDADAVDVMQALLLDQVVLGVSRAGLATRPALVAALREHIDARLPPGARRDALHALLDVIGGRDKDWSLDATPHRETLAHLERTEGYYWANKSVRAALRLLPLSARALSTAGEIHWLNANMEATFAQLREEHQSIDEMLQAFCNATCLPLAERYAGVALGEPMRALLRPILTRLGRVIRWQHEEALAVAPADPDKADDLPAFVSLAEGIAREPRLRAAAAKHAGLPANITAAALLEALPAERLVSWLRSRHAFETIEGQGISIAQTLARIATATVAPLSDDSHDVQRPVSALRAIDVSVATAQVSKARLAEARALVLGLLMHPGHAGGIDALPTVKAPLELKALKTLMRTLETMDEAADARLAERYGLNDDDLAALQNRRQSMQRQLVANFAPTQMRKLTLPPNVQASALTVDAKRQAVAVYEGVRRFVQDPLRSLRALQGLEAAVLQRHREAHVPLETAFMQILEEAERAAGLSDAVPVTGGLAGQPFHKMLREGHPFDDIIFFSQPHGSKTHRLQNLLVMRAMQEDPAAFGGDVDNWGVFYKILGNRVLRRELGFPRGDQQEDLWRMLFDALHTSNFGCADAVKSIATHHAPWLGDIEHTPLALDVQRVGTRAQDGV